MVIDWNGNERIDPVDIGISLSSVSYTESTIIDLCGYPFEFIQELTPAKNAVGKIKTFDPKNRYMKRKTTPLNRYGEGPFCRFSLNAGEYWGVAGVYALFDDESLLYIGLTQNFAQRFNQGYGIIAPKNCYVGGQSTNCKINSMVLSKYQNGNHIYLFFCETTDYKNVEAELIAAFSPPYNGTTCGRERRGLSAVEKDDYTEMKKNHPKKQNGGIILNDDFEPIWQAILAHAGEEFYTATGKSFTYAAHGSYIISSNAQTAKLARGNFEKAYRNMDVYSPTEFSHKIIGSSYVKAILRDQRIK